VRYIVVDGFCPWVRGGCIARSWGQSGSRCDEGVYPSNHAQHIVEILQPPFFLASLVFWLFLPSMVFGDNFVSSSCLYTLWNTCFKCNLIEWWDVSLISSSSALQPWVGLGLSLRFRNNIFFYRVRLLASCPTPNLEGQGIPFCLGHHP
jgi:hypothetical protein